MAGAEPGPRTAVASYLLRAKGANLSWPLPEDLDDVALEKALFVAKEDHRPRRAEPDYAWVHRSSGEST